MKLRKLLSVHAPEFKYQIRLGVVLRYNTRLSTASDFRGFKVSWLGFADYTYPGEYLDFWKEEKFFPYLNDDVFKFSISKSDPVCLEIIIQNDSLAKSLEEQED